MKILLAICLALALPINGYAKPKHWYTSKKFWAGEAVIGLSVFLDYQSTQRNHAFGESNRIFNGVVGNNPSTARVAGFGLTAFAVESATHVALYKLSENDPSKYWRFAGLTAQPAISFGVHVPAAIHNYTFQNAK